MAHVRIRCRLPQLAMGTIAGVAPKGSAGFPLINGLVASWPDVEVLLVEDDGTERAWLGVTSVEFKATAGDEPITAKIEVLNPEIDVMAEAELHPLAARIFDLVDDSDSWSHFDRDPTPEERADVIRSIAATLKGKIGVAR